MRISKLLNKKYLSILLILFLFKNTVNSTEPADIWNLEKNKDPSSTEKIENSKTLDTLENSIYEMQSGKIKKAAIKQDETLVSSEDEIIGLYDPAENGLDINMWSNSDGSQILKLFNRLKKIDLSDDASEILNILLLTNSYYPNNNISRENFIEIKSNWLIKNSNLKLIEDYLLNNQTVNDNPQLTKFLVDEYLSRSQIEKSCEIISKIIPFIEDEYLSKFKIYCLINNNKFEQAQLLLDLKKEVGFKDDYYEKKINYLMGYEKNDDKKISENSILDFHLSHRINAEFKFEPDNLTSKKIWKYLSTSNLLYNIQDIKLTDFDRIATIEKATHEKNYTEKALYSLYKRFQFNINQLLNIKEASKLLSTTEARALTYQGILITTEVDKKLELINALKNSFIKEGITNAFDEEMIFFLKEINKDNVPANYTTFYEKYTNEEQTFLTNIKINNKILHQSKLINYFKKDVVSKNINKDLNDLLKKIKKNKKYFLSKKDVIMIESFKSDGVKVSKKYDDLYKVDESEIPSDIQILINNQDMGVAMLRIVEVIGQDQLIDIDPETLYFIISTLNQLNIDPIRNKILLKVLPLKI